MKIALISAAPLRKLGALGSMYPPLGIMYLSSYLRFHLDTRSSKIWGIKVFDGYILGQKKLRSRLEEFAPDIVGLSFTTQAATGAYNLIGEMRKTKYGEQCPIICGGPHASALPEEVVGIGRGDIAVIGEGEETLLELVLMLENNPKQRKQNLPEYCRNIKGIAYPLGENSVVKTPPRPLIQDLDSLPMPDRNYVNLDVYPGLYYKKAARETNMVSSRGCPFNCVFCSSPVWKINKPWYRLSSPKSVVDEIAWLSDDHRGLGFPEIYDQTDSFSSDMEWAKAVCDEIHRRGIKVALKAQIRANRIDRELARKMKRAGFWLTMVGAESANQSTLDGIHKGTTTEQNEEALRCLKAEGIMSFALLMAFNAWETDGKLYWENKSDTMKTLEWAKAQAKAGNLDLASWSLTTPYPGSALYDIANRHMLIPPDVKGQWELWDSSERMVMELPGVTMADWIEVQNAGKWFQAKLLLKSGTINRASIPMYAKRALSQITKRLRVAF